MGIPLHVIFIVCILFVSLCCLWYLRKKDTSSAWKKSIRHEVAALDVYASSGDLIQIKHALLEADKLLDHVFKKKRYKGETMGKRLIHAKGVFPWKQYQEIWNAHKVRNSLVHDIHTTVKKEQMVLEYRVLKRAILHLV